VRFDPVSNRDWMLTHSPAVPVIAVLVYAAGIVLGQRYFGNKQPWDWRRTMAAWNLGLALFSLTGFLRTAPQLYHNFTHFTVRENFCFDPESHFGSGSTGLWVQLFILSKFPELIDTFFIVIHKKKLIFLHWYHHISVLFYCWHAYVTKSPVGLIFCVMNYAVHAIMYFYYFLMAVRFKPKSFKAVYITAAQISQMVVGVAVTTLGCYLLWWDKSVLPENCWLTPDNNVAALIMYGSYLGLFLEFFFQRYQSKGGNKNSERMKTAAKRTGASKGIKEE
jgi:elongation of very long chain fatty acids protein 6